MSEEPGRNSPPECTCPNDQPWEVINIYVYNVTCPIHNPDNTPTPPEAPHE